MAIESSGTLTTTGSGTEDALGSAATTEGVRVLRIDFNDAVAGDIFEVYSKEKILTGGTIRVGPLDEWFMGDDWVNATSKIWTSDPLKSSFGTGFYVKQFAGTASLPWSVETP